MATTRQVGLEGKPNGNKQTGCTGRSGLRILDWMLFILRQPVLTSATVNIM